MMLTTVRIRTVAASAAMFALAFGAPNALAQTTPTAAPSSAGDSAASSSPSTGSSPSTSSSPQGTVANATTPAAPSSATTPPAAASTPAGSTTPSDTAAKPEAPGAAVTAPPPSASPPASAAATTPAAPAAGSQAATTPPSSAAPAAPAAQEAAPAAQAAAPAAPAVDPVIAAVRSWLAQPSSATKTHKDDVAAAVAFYEARSTGGALWVEASGFNAKAKSAMDEVRKADDWGLSASDFDLPSLTSSASPEAQAEAEAKLTLELLKYARHARGGRVNPQSLSRILDQAPPVRDPNAVLTELAAAAAPDAFLRDLHPKHAGFVALHKALLAARGPAEPAMDVDPALKVVLPSTKATLKKGVDAPQVALLRQRLKVPAGAGESETLFDEKLELAVKAFQVERGIKATGQLSGATRVSLNNEAEGHRTPNPERDTLRIVLNMERWRWMPEDLGKIYVQNNIPEYMTRVHKGDEVIFTERIIVGLPAWATPVFTAEMEFVGFNPSWGMPDGIKMRELAPRLQAAGGGDFFSQLFGGGGGAAASIRAHGLKVYAGGREVSPESVNWGSVDLRKYSFIQPPGGKNPLGTVKFRFPNKHDVYMHDTIERNLFAQSNRALSHGCIRVQNPKRFAEIMLAEGNGLDDAGVQRAVAGGGEIHLDHKIPVHMTYFTAVAGEDGKVSTYADIYGHDGKLSAALTGKTLRLDPVVDMSSAETAAATEDAPAASNKQASKKKKKVYQAPDTLADAISGFWMN